MTVANLQDQLSKLPADARVVVYWETDNQFFEIDEVSLRKGTPKRIKGKAGFEFDSQSGIAAWVFVSVEAA
jgi:hypothetical protein